MLAKSLRLSGLMLSLFFAGCGPTGPRSDLPLVSGEVTYDGKPVKEGMITFQTGGDQGSEYSANILDGRYQIQMPKQKMKVAITGWEEVPGQFRVDPNNRGEKLPLKTQFIPKEYNTDTTLEVEISKSNQDFQLKTP